MPEPDDEMITFRISPRDRQAIARLIEQGEFRNRSDFLRYAVRSALDNIHLARAGADARPNLELEGVELPTASGSAANGSRGRGRGARKGVNL